MNPPTPPGRAGADPPPAPELHVDRPEVLEAFLRQRGWLSEGETLSGLAPAGEGNMNLALRATIDRRDAAAPGAERRSVVVKQSRPWVEKHPTIAAPLDRARVEAAFYQRVSRTDHLSALMPGLIGSDAQACVLVLEDLGEAADFSGLYRGDPIADEELIALAGWAARLHRVSCGSADPALANRAMRRLNHAHIFELPVSGGLDLPLDTWEPGLAEAAAALRADGDFVAAVHRWGRRYLEDGPCLLHGDYYPGSWLRTAEGPRVIDPEFCFFGDPAFDSAVALAHLALAGAPLKSAHLWLEAYREAGGPPLAGDALAGYAGTEVMRRLIGVAQLPLPRTHDGRRAEWLAAAQETLKQGDLDRLWN